VIERAYILCSSTSINQKHLPAKLVPSPADRPVALDAMNLVETEKRLIVKALNQTGWNQSKAAEILGITRKQLRTKMKNLELLPE
jgi:two-component system response regulator HydG/two-component system response regulator AtoC